jgi:hypothetical protein
MIALNMTAYPSVRKPALEAPEPVELEFARDTPQPNSLAAERQAADGIPLDPGEPILE